MQAGRYRHYGSYEMRLDVAFTGYAASAGHAATGYGELYSGAALSQHSSKFKAAWMKIIQTKDGTSGIDTLTYQLTIPGVYSDGVSSLTFAAATYSRLVFTNLKLYWFGTYWEISWDSFDWYTDSTLYYTRGAGTLDSTIWEAKCAVQLFGIQPCLSASFLAESVPAPPAGGATTGHVDADGGWRFQEPGSSTWITPPVTTNVKAPLQIGGCAVGVYPTSTPTATNTFNGHVEADINETYDGVGAVLISESYGNSIWLVDDCPTSVEKLGSDYYSLWVSGGFPQTEHLQSGTCLGSTTNTYTTEHAAVSEFLNTVSNAAHTIEDVFGLDVVAPYEMAGSRYSQAAGGSHFGSSSFPARITFDGTELPYYKHLSDNLVNYLNYWGARHCHFLKWMPDSTGLGHQWPVNLIEPSTNEFWLPEAKQWLDHPDLPGGEDRGTQVNQPWSPFLQGFLATGFHIVTNVFANAATSFIGLHNFDVEAPTIPATKQLDTDSEDAWTFTDCTASFGGGGITLTPVAMASPIEAVFDAGMFGVEPYYYPMIAESVLLDIDMTNVDSMEVFIVDSLGKELSISTGAYPDTYPFVSSQDEYYSGSWAQEHGASLLSNVGVDQQATGQSLTHMSDPNFAEAFQMFAGRGAHKLKFVIVPTNPALSVLLKYPTYTYATTDPVIVPECSGQAAILWPDGPGLRFGSWNWFYMGDVQDSPLFRQSSSRTTSLDWLVTRRTVFEGIAGTSGLDAEIASLYDAVEGQTRDEAASNTLAFWVP